MKKLVKLIERTRTFVAHCGIDSNISCVIASSVCVCVCVYVSLLLAAVCE